MFVPHSCQVPNANVVSADRGSMIRCSDKGQQSETWDLRGKLKALGETDSLGTRVTDGCLETVRTGVDGLAPRMGNEIRKPQ